MRKYRNAVLTEAMFLGALEAVLEDEFRGFPLPVRLHTIQRHHGVVGFG
jgi:hypothetical protein